jgi:acetyltransferase
MAVADTVLEGALRQAGVLRVRGIDELLATLIGFQDMPLPRGGRIALVTYSGGQAIMSIDEAVENGLEVARFADTTRQKLAEVIAMTSKAGNPVDLYPDMMVHGFEKTSMTIVRALLEDDGVDAIIFIAFAMFGAEPYLPLAQLIEEKRTKPVFFSLMGTKEDVENCRAFMESHRMPCYLFPEMGVRVLAHMRRYARRNMEA